MYINLSEYVLLKIHFNFGWDECFLTILSNLLIDKAEILIIDSTTVIGNLITILPLGEG